jgi:hypothetical protein
LVDAESIGSQLLGEGHGQARGEGLGGGKVRGQGEGLPVGECAKEDDLSTILLTIAFFFSRGADYRMIVTVTASCIERLNAWRRASMRLL